MVGYVCALTASTPINLGFLRDMYNLGVATAPHRSVGMWCLKKARCVDEPELHPRSRCWLTHRWSSQR